MTFHGFLPGTCLVGGGRSPVSLTNEIHQGNKPTSELTLRAKNGVVFAPHFSIGPGAADFHPRCAFGMEKKWGAPAIAEFALRVDRGVIDWNE